MAITLETIASVGSTPIPNNSASSVSFAADYFKSAVPNLTTRQRLAISIVALTHGFTTPDYTANHAGLIQDAAVYTKGISQFDWATSFVGLCWTLGKSQDATLSDDVDVLLAEARDLENLSEEELWRVLATVFAQLNP